MSIYDNERLKRLQKESEDDSARRDRQIREAAEAQVKEDRKESGSESGGELSDILCGQSEVFWSFEAEYRGWRGMKFCPLCDCPMTDDSVVCDYCKQKEAQKAEEQESKESENG